MFDSPILSHPGDGMTIKRIPLPDDLVRLEALKVGVSLKRDSFASSLIETATKLESYIRNGDPKAEEPRIWGIDSNDRSNQLFSISSETMVSELAEAYPDTIYFFARLVNCW